jgi:hypothetical protein
VTAQLSSYTVVGTGTVQTYSNDLRAMSWTDGTPTASSTANTRGVSITATGAGFSFTAPADQTSRRLIVHVGGTNSGGTLSAHLSDATAADYVNVSSTAGGRYDRNYTITYNAAGAGQTLTVTWTRSSGNGRVTLSGAALAIVSGP